MLLLQVMITNESKHTNVKKIQKSFFPSSQKSQRTVDVTLAGDDDKRIQAHKCIENLEKFCYSSQKSGCVYYSA